MGLTATKAMRSKVADLLDREWETPDEAAAAVLELAWELYEARAKFSVVGQLRYSPGEGGGYLDPEDARASCMSLGNYATEAQARSAGESLAFSSATGEEFRWWLLPVHHGTPATFYAARLEARKARELAARNEASGDPVADGEARVEQVREQLEAAGAQPDVDRILAALDEHLAVVADAAPLHNDPRAPIPPSFD